MPVVEDYCPFVSVIIPTYKDWETLPACLDALTRQTYPTECFEVIVVDNNPKPSSQFELHGENHILIREPKPGSYAARNTGIESARGGIYAFTDSDCVPDSEWLKSGVEYFKRHPEVSYLGGRIQLHFQDQKLTLAETCEKAFAFRQHEILSGRNYTVTANMMARREVFARVGRFDEQLLSCGDGEWCNRATSLGEIIGYSSDAVVYHPARYALRDLFRRYLRVAGGQFLVARPKSKRIIVFFVGLLPPVVPFGKLIRRSDLSAIEKLKALSVLYVMRIARSIAFILIASGIVRPQRA